MSKKLMYTWGVIVVIICASLIVLGNIGGNYELYKLERNIKLSSKKYMKDNDLLPNFNESQIVYIDELIDKNYIKDNENIDKYCIVSIEYTKSIIDKYNVIKECKTMLNSKK